MLLLPNFSFSFSFINPEPKYLTIRHLHAFELLIQKEPEAENERSLILPEFLKLNLVPAEILLSTQHFRKFLSGFLEIWAID